MDTSAMIGFAAGVILIYLVGYLLMMPGKLALRLLINACLGGIGLMVVGMVGPVWGITVGVNLVTALTVGFLGIPGVVLLILLSHLFGL